MVLRGRHKRAVQVQIPMADIGGPCEIVCERGVGRVPLLVAIINLTALSNGGVALHASAFEHEGRGVVATGWSKGGKTESLLAFLARGARYVADEWVYLDPASRRAGGLREPVRVWDWHLTEMQDLRQQASLVDRTRLRTLRLAAGLPFSRVPGGSRVSHVVDTHRYVDLPPEQLGIGSFDGGTTTLERLFLVTSTDQPGTSVRPADPLEVADRMVGSLAFERLPLLSWYHAFRYAFPTVRNRRLEDASTLERERLRAAFDGVATFAVDHPYPVSLHDLGAAMAPCIRDDR